MRPAEQASASSEEGRGRPRTGTRAGVGAGLSEVDRAWVRAAVLALPPLTDEQIAGVCEVIAASRARWQQERAGAA